MEEIRLLTEEELDEHFNLSEFAFQYTLTSEEREKRMDLTQPGDIWGFFVDGKLAGKMTIIPFETFIQEKTFAMGGIASVATWPEYRRKGIVRQLLTNALKVMKEKGQTVSFLHPFSFSFYRKFGWETFIEYKQYELPMDLCPVFPCTKGKMVRVKEDWMLLNGIYETYAKTFNGLLKRDRVGWENRGPLSKKGVCAVFYNDEQKAEGYIVYEVKNNVMTIHELVFLNEEARKGIWKFIGDHDSMVKTIVFKAPSNDQFSFLLSNPRIKQEVIPYFMARIVDVERFLDQYPLALSHCTRPFFLRVEDSHAPWNTGTFKIEAPEQQVYISRVHHESDADRPVISCSIETLSAMFLGYQTPAFLHQIGRLQGDLEEINSFASLLSPKTTYLMDFF